MWLSRFLVTTKGQEKRKDKRREGIMEGGNRGKDVPQRLAIKKPPAQMNQPPCMRRRYVHTILRTVGSHEPRERAGETSGGRHSKSMQETDKKRRRKTGGEARMHASSSICPNIPRSTPAPEPEPEIQNETRVKGKEGRQQRSACWAIRPLKRKRQARSGEARAPQKRAYTHHPAEKKEIRRDEWGKRRTTGVSNGDIPPNEDSRLTLDRSVRSGTRKGGVDVLLHIGDVLKGPEGEMVLGRVLVGGNPKIAYFGLKWTILDGVMPRLAPYVFFSGHGGEKEAGREECAREVVVEHKARDYVLAIETEAKAKKLEHPRACVPGIFWRLDGSASTRHSDYSENKAKLGNDSRRDKTTHAEETGTYKTIDRSDK
ncbi:hypothetical protein B0H14DRAFT_2604658 [Mycena olivaceomarginata]|nr:hypothetical protein B0H14DRAFT_2604658 [Mycena olivaceomarginata]